MGANKINKKVQLRSANREKSTSLTSGATPVSARKGPKPKQSTTNVSTLSGQVVISTTEYKQPSAKKPAGKNHSKRSASVQESPAKSALPKNAPLSKKTPTRATVKSAGNTAKKTAGTPRPSKAKTGGIRGGRKTSSGNRLSRTPAKPLIQFPTMKWGTNATLSFEATEHLPPPELTSIAGGFIFYQDKLLLANIPGRGWEIVGGRIDLGESPEMTFRREALNQVGVQVEHLQMLGMMRIEHGGPQPPNCPYPFPTGYGIQFVGIATELPYFRGSSDSLGRSLITPDGFREHYFEWNEFYDSVFRYAYEVYQKMKKKLKL
jgi:8-oxo-dGTP pyrophosphatase MutT (NUDIX family)